MAARKTARKVEPRAYHHGDLARALLEEALRLIRDSGPDAVSLRELARRIGVNHASVYRHYEDKASLLAAVAEDGWSRLVVAMRTATEGEGVRELAPNARLLRLGTAYIEFALSHPAHYRVMMGPRLNETGRFPSLERPIGEAFQLMIAAIEEGRRKGSFREGTAQDWALRVWMFGHGYVTLVLGRRVHVKPSRMEAYFESLLRPLLGMPFTDSE